MTNNKNEEQQETKKYTVNKSSTEEVTEEPSLNRGNKANQKTTSATDITEENSDPENKNAGINSRKQALEEEAEKQKSKKTKTET